MNVARSVTSISHASSPAGSISKDQHKSLLRSSLGGFMMSFDDDNEDLEEGDGDLGGGNEDSEEDDQRTLDLPGPFPAFGVSPEKD